MKYFFVLAVMFIIHFCLIQTDRKSKSHPGGPGKVPDSTVVLENGLKGLFTK
jgi:hypothetical protein